MRMAKLGMHYIRNEHALEQPREDFNGIDQHQIASGAGIRDGGTHAASKAKSGQRLQLAFQFLQRDAVVIVVRLQEPVDFVAGFETEQSPKVRSGQTAGAIFLCHQRLESAALETDTAGAEALGKVVADMDGQVHGHTVSEGPQVVSITRGNGRHHG